MRKSHVAEVKKKIMLKEGGREKGLGGDRKGEEDRSGKDREVDSDEREEMRVREEKGTTRNTLFQNHLNICVHEIPCCISSECNRRSKREYEEEIERR